MGECRLAHTRDVFDQQMAAREQAHQGELDHFIFTPDDALHGLLHALEKVRSDGGVIIHCGFFHAVESRVCPGVSRPWAKNLLCSIVAAGD